ncbi:MAG TPA: M56 family metallopeptidase [Terracidiphilus sp.]|nr:M56 family metallopeptidase [Terracidiphilus sp.]
MPLIHMAEAVLAASDAGAKWADAAFSGFAQAAAPAAIAALWQSLLIAFAMVLCLRFLLRASAAQRFAAWAAAFAVAALLPILPLIENLLVARFGPVAATAPATGTAAHSWFELDSRWALVIAALWLAGSAFRAMELMFDLRRLRRLWHRATPLEPDASLRTLLAGLSPIRRVEICTTPDLDRPSVIGFFAPRVLIPDWLYPRLTPGELEQVVLHEAEHLRRRDDWTNLLQKLSLVVFPLNPALAWMERRLCREREMACDEGVIERTRAPRSYAACLTSLAEREFERRQFLRRAQALSLGAFERRPELAHRVHSILRRRPALHPVAAGTLVGVVACGLLAAAVELARSPMLVAFVAAPDAQSAALARVGSAGPDQAQVSDVASNGATTPAGDDAVFHPSQHFRAVETSAVMPLKQTGRPAAARPNRTDKDHSAETAMNVPGLAPRANPTHSAMQTPDALSPQPQEFVVLTAWEEVQTSALRPRSFADYDTGEGTPEQSGAAKSQAHQNVDAPITYTRLILFVVPTNATTSAPTKTAQGSKPARTSSSRSYQPPTFDSGWLFFQL